MDNKHFTDSHILIPLALVTVSIVAMKPHNQKQVSEERLYLAYTLQHCSSLKEIKAEHKQGRSLEAGAYAEAMED